MTLVELLVAAALAAILLTLFLWVLIPTFEASSRVGLLVEMQQVAVAAFDRMNLDLSNTPPAGFHGGPLGSQRVTVALHPLARVTVSGEQVFDDRVVLYQWRSGSLHRSAWLVPGGGTQVPFRPGRDDWQTMINQSSGSRILAAGVEEFEFKAPTANSATMPITLRMVLKRQWRERTEQFQLKRQVWLPNTL